MRFAYADPPYVGQARKHYEQHPDYAGEVDHEELLMRLVSEFSDGWALSCSVPSLPALLRLLGGEPVRILAWASWCAQAPLAYPSEPETEALFDA